MSLGLSDIGSQRLGSLMPTDEPRHGAPRLAISY
jgi:hypothetical protein